MADLLAFIHTVPSLVGLFTSLAQEILPADVEVLHIADEILLKVVLAKGGLTPFIFQRVADHVIACERAGADAVQLTCSSISPCAEPAARLVEIPVLKVDEPMVDQALLLGQRIGVAATAPTTLQPTTELVRQRAAAAGRTVEVDALVCHGAYEALFAGATETHDRIVREHLRTLMSRNEVVILAQASMARVLETLPTAERRVPILSSPRLAVERLRQILAGGAGA
ncbi:MAG TPA: aspartate/glutamate racemase family protein [Anaerolineales bacterium]|nr:aspartate/glutamate racemase family protein [Anaerolineales bacterium]